MSAQGKKPRLEEPSNPGRSQRAEDALAAYLDDGGGHTAVVDLLSDLRHYCDTYGVSFADADRMAHTHYTTEVVEARAGR